MGSIQRGGMVAKNDNGTLERVDGTNTYIGSATLENGKVITKRFRGNVPDEQKIVERWLKWQGRKTEDEEMAEIIKVDDGNKTPKCPFSGCECNAKCPLWSEAQRVCSLKLAGIGLSYVAANLMNLKVDEELELIALAIAESGKKTDKPKAEPVKELTATDGVEFFLADKKFLDFVNLTSKRVFSDYKKALANTDYPLVKESELTTAIAEKFPELKKKTVHGGSVLIAA